MKYFAGCHVQDFAALARVCANDPAFPRTVLEWDQLVATALQVAAAEGFVYDACEIDPHAFETWCAIVAVVPCLDALKAYAIVRRAQVTGRSVSVPLHPGDDSVLTPSPSSA